MWAVDSSDGVLERLNDEHGSKKPLFTGVRMGCVFPREARCRPLEAVKERQSSIHQQKTSESVYTPCSHDILKAAGQAQEKERTARREKHRKMHFSYSQQAREAIIPSTTCRVRVVLEGVKRQIVYRVGGDKGITECGGSAW